MPRKPKSPFPPPPPGVWVIKKRDRNWMVIAPVGALVCVASLRLLGTKRG